MSEHGEFGQSMPSVVVPPPGPESADLARRLSRHEFPACSIIGPGRTPVFWKRAAGANVEDVDGNIYVDLTAGFCVAVAGHSNPRVVKAISEQASQLIHSQGGLNPNPQRVWLTEKLASLAPPGLTASMILSTGAEAVDVAIKTARLYTGRHTIIAFQRGFHGKTLGALNVSSQNYYREPVLPLLQGTVHIPYPDQYRGVFGHSGLECARHCADYLEYLLTMEDSAVSNVAAVIMEPVQGHGGWNIPPRDFVQRIREICSRHNILLIADEIITAFGRCGHMFAMNHFGVVPDIITVGKGMASGFPISAVLTRPELAGAFKSMQHSSTFVGHPLGCAASLACLQDIEERQLISRGRELGAYLKDQLLAMQPRHPLMGDVRGLGMMVGIELVRDRVTKQPASDLGHQVVHNLLQRGIMATNYGGTYHNVIKLSPPLVITREQLDWALRCLDDSLGEVEAGVDWTRPVEDDQSGQTRSMW